MKMLYCLALVALMLCGCAPVGFATDAQVDNISQRLADMQTQLNTIQERVENIPTPTPEPTPAPSPTNLPQTYTMTTEEIVQGLIDAGMKIGRHEVYDETTDPNDMFGRPSAYTDKANFWDTRVGTGKYDDAGMLEVFMAPDDAMTRMAYITNLYVSGLVQAQYCIRYENLLLRFDMDFKPSYVDEYVTAMSDILGMQPSETNLGE